MQQAVFDPVRKIDYQPDNQPNYKPDPGHGRESRHQKNARRNAQEGKDRVQRDLERAMPVRLFDAQDNDPEANKNEREESSNICQVHHLIDIGKSGGAGRD